MSKVEKSGGHSIPAGAPKGGPFWVEVRQPNIIYQIAYGGGYGTNLVDLSDTRITDQVFRSEETVLVPVHGPVLPRSYSLADRGPIAPPSGNLPTFSLDSLIVQSEAQLLRPDEGYYNEERVRRIQQLIEALGSRANFRTRHNKKVNLLLIENNEVYALADFGFSSRAILEQTLLGQRQSRKNKERLKEEIAEAASRATPPYLHLRLRGRNPDTKEGESFCEDEEDFIDQLANYARIYEHLIKAVYAEQDAPLPNASIILRPPILDQDSLTKAASLETRHPPAIVKEQVRTERLSFDDIAGQDEAIKEAKRLVLAINNQQVYEKRGARKPKGILFYGPPGTGKTLLAKIIAQEADADFVPITVADIGSKWYGESENLMQRVFDSANERAMLGRKVVIFFDEIEALAPQRQELTHETTAAVLSIILQNMDGMKSNPNVTVIAATNMPERIDPALKRSGRFDKLIEVGLPNEQGRAAILAVHLEKARRRASASDELFADIDLQAVGKATPEMSGADLENLINLIIEEKTMAELEGQLWTPISTQDLIYMAKKASHQKEEKRKIGFQT